MSGLETAFLLLMLMPAAGALSWLLLLLARAESRLDWLFPVRGRWREYAAVGLPFVVLMLAFPGPERILVPLVPLLVFGADRLRASILYPAGAPRIKSIDVGTGIRLIPETGGAPTEDLRFELELWQAAGRETLARASRGELAP